MKFLVVSKSKMPFPSEMALGLVQAMEGWAKKYTANHKIEQIWNFAGLQGGGGGILNVNSLDELNAIMTECPFVPFSEIEIYGLADFQVTLQTLKQVIQAMTPPSR